MKADAETLCRLRDSRHGSRRRWTAPAENVPSGVDVAVVDRPATNASPFPYHETLSTFRAADESAIGTGLRASTFRHLGVCPSVRNRFVTEERPKSRPTCVIHGLRAVGFREPRGANVTDKDRPMLPNEACTELVKEVSSLVGGLGEAGPSETLFACPLCRTYFGCRVLKPSRHTGFLARGQGGEVLKPEINADTTNGSSLHLFRNFTHDVEVPPTARVLSERRSVTDSVASRERPGHPYIPPRTQHVEGRRVVASGKLPERNPSKGALAAKTQETLVVPAKGGAVLCACRSYYDRTYAKRFRAAGGQGVEIKAAGPAVAALDCRTLCLVTEVPDDVYGARHTAERFSVLVFHAITERLNHSVPIIAQRCAV